MKCKRCSKQLMSLVQNELSQRERAEVESHLASCEACVEELAGLEATLRLVDGQPGLEPSEQFDAGFARRLAAAEREGEAGPARASSWWRLPALASAAVAACALVVVLAVTRTSRPPATPDGPGEMALIRDLDLLQSYDVVKNLDGLEDYDLVMGLDDLLASDRGNR